MTTLVRDMHAGIAGRVFGAIGPSSKPTQVIHDGIARTVYGTVDHGLRGATKAGGVLASQVWGRGDDEGLDSRGRVAGALAAVNGIYGHQLASHRNGLALTMQIRQHGSVVPLSDESLSAASRATGDGRCSSTAGAHERSWSASREATRAAFNAWGLPFIENRPHVSALRPADSYSQNGQMLAGMLERLQRLWPVPIDEFVLVGHSMGGLVARSASFYGMQQHHWWTAAVRHVVCLGSPHLGADLEKGVNVAAWALGRLPRTRRSGWLSQQTQPGRQGSAIRRGHRGGLA